MPKVKSSWNAGHDISTLINFLGTTERSKEDKLREAEELVLGKGSDILKSVASKKSEDEEEEELCKQPAWVDDNDGLSFESVVKIQGRKCTPRDNGTVPYQSIVEEKFQSVMGKPKWARRSKTKETGNKILQSSGSLVQESSSLLKDQLEFKKMKDLNQETYTEGPVIKVVKFHPTSTVAMVAGLAGIVSLFQVDGKHNSKLQSIHFKRYPVHCGAFLNNGEEFLIGSRHHKYFYSHNLISGHSMKIDNSKIIDVTKTDNFIVSPDNKFIVLCGRFGDIYLLSAHSKEFITSFKMNCQVKSVVFTCDGSLLLSHGTDGEVYVWDMKKFQCAFRFIDEGCLTGTSLAAASNGKLLACGSSSGIVNIYNTNHLVSNQHKSIKAVGNLVTSIDSLLFNPTSEILSFSSSYKDNSIKMLHVESMTVFSNFPSNQNRSFKPQCVDFSPNSGFYAVGDNKGSAQLFRLKYYGNY